MTIHTQMILYPRFIGYSEGGNLKESQLVRLALMPYFLIILYHFVNLKWSLLWQVKQVEAVDIMH